MKDLIYLAITSSAMCAIIALYAHLVGFSQRGKLDSESQAKDLLGQHNPGKNIASLKLSDDQRTALAEFSDGTASLLYPLGRRWVTHTLAEDSISKIKTLKNGSLQIGFPDFTAPRMTIFIEDETSGAAWLSALRPYMRTSVSTNRTPAPQ